MKFVLLDRITELESGKRIVACKALSLAEEYLADHFPRFPVMPGVLMLEAMVQTASWLVREKLDFAPSLVVLKEARNVTYKSFLAPGQVLQVQADCIEFEPDHSTYNGRGLVGEREIVKGRFTLRHLTLGAGSEETDQHVRAALRARWNLLWKGSPVAATAGAPGNS